MEITGVHDHIRFWRCACQARTLPVSYIPSPEGTLSYFSAVPRLSKLSFFTCLGTVIGSSSARIMVIPSVMCAIYSAEALWGIITLNLPKDSMRKAVNTPYCRGETSNSRHGPGPCGAGMKTPLPYGLLDLRSSSMNVA